MHECPECGQACDCDGEDTWMDYVTDCVHECDPDYDDEEERDWDEEWNEEDDAREAAYEEPTLWMRWKHWWWMVGYRFWAMGWLVRKCPKCGKPEWLLGRIVGNHEKCWPEYFEQFEEGDQMPEDLAGDVEDWRCEECGNLFYMGPPAKCPNCGSEKVAYEGYTSYDDEGHKLASYDEDGRPIQ